MATWRARGGRPLTTFPPISTSPSVASSSPAIVRSSVVLPQPDGPLPAPLLEDRLDLRLGAGHRLLRRLAPARGARVHVGHDERAEHLADGGVRAAVPAHVGAPVERVLQHG